MAIGISISGRTEEVMECLKQAHRQGAYTVLLTANDRPEYSEFCEEVVCLAQRKTWTLAISSLRSIRFL